MQSHSALRRRTVSFNVDSKQYFFTVTSIVTYEFIYCWYNSLFKQVVSDDRRARAVALEKSKWYRSLSRGLVEFRAVMIAEPWADCVQRGDNRGAVAQEEFCATAQRSSPR